jgi:hypothetical protein
MSATASHVADSWDMAHEGANFRHQPLSSLEVSRTQRPLGLKGRRTSVRTSDQTRSFPDEWRESSAVTIDTIWPIVDKLDETAIANRVYVRADWCIHRHGTRKPLESDYPKLDTLCKRLLQPKNELDQTRIPAWPDNFFGHDGVRADLNLMIDRGRPPKQAHSLLTCRSTRERRLDLRASLVRTNLSPTKVIPTILNIDGYGLRLASSST